MATRTTSLRNGVAQLSTLAANDLDRLWRQVNDAVQAREALLDILPALIDTYGAAAGTLAADWYDEIRTVRGVAGRFGAVVATLPNDGGSAELARWGVGPLFGAAPDWAAAASLVAGGLQRRIANVSRFTVTMSSVQDPQARGWQRVGVGGCEFCRMLLDRGAVYTEATADFESHDHCRCSAEPAW